MVLGWMICAEINFPRVARQLAVFEAFAAASKIVEIHPVVLTRDSTKVEYVGKAEVGLGWAGFPCRFEATRSPKVNMKYGLKLFAKYFDEKACFRFDSAGPTHMNEETGGGLVARMVPTPHFHRVDNNGILYAYQTAPLLDTAERAKIISSPQLGANLFCQEANLFSPNGGFVVVKIMATELDLSTGDPLDGATFPP